jgi:cyclopropane fatty-acyl-phospholipid synthase-like methyltransferase
MDNYLSKNKEYYDKGYEAENVESYVFRAYGRIFKHDFGLDGSKGEKLLDFGCGSGASLKFFKSKGFNVYGVDISEVDIQRAQSRMSDIKENFLVIPPKPSANDLFFGGQFDVVISIQTLYFLSNSDLQVRLKTLYDMMKPGALIYASMMGTQAYFSKYATPAEDGLSKIEFSNDRISYKDFYVNLIKNKRDLEEKFSIFKKVYIGYYDRDYRNEGSEFHYTFTGQKNEPR